MALSDILFYVVGIGLVVMAAITIWAVTAPHQALFLG